MMLREDGFALDDGTVCASCRRPLFSDHDNRKCRTRFSTHAFLPSGLVARTGRAIRFGDRSMGAVLDRRAERAKALDEGVDARYDLERGISVYGSGRRTGSRWHAARLYRISFSGELAYEIGVGARYGDALAQVLMQAGAPYDIAPYGTEALSVMRIEKGHVAGNEIDGRTTARDLGLGRMMSTKKDYIGRVLAGRPALADPDRMLHRRP